PESAPGLELDRLADVVDEVVRERGLFADHESTLFNMRGQYHDPRVFQRLTRPQWIAAGRPDPVREAHARADELVAAYDYPAPPEDILRELRRIYERAKGKLL
ncbi:MAG: Trimethylamine methyltransferase, partial [Candidatus Hydrogenedentes bacterium]|nr:Trimethylamine methyltransferase [Candidatus Hydrogenedentota bacterium]